MSIRACSRDACSPDAVLGNCSHRQILWFESPPGRRSGVQYESNREPVEHRKATWVPFSAIDQIGRFSSRDASIGMTSIAPPHTTPTSAFTDINDTARRLYGPPNAPPVIHRLFDVAPATATETENALACGLAGYIRAVARAAGIDVEGTSSEVTDTATAYLALEQRCSAIPDRDLMLAWSECDGWRIAVETEPDEASIILAYLGGDILPSPQTVAQFITNLTLTPQTSRPHPHYIPTRQDLNVRLSRYRTPPSNL